MKNKYISPEIKVEDIVIASTLADVSYIADDGYGDLSSKHDLMFWDKDEDEEE